MNPIIPTCPMIFIRNGFKCFKISKTDNTNVLQNFSMTVETGTLYALLGSSGSGKTTILSCLAGLQTLDTGHISVFGGDKCPNSHHHRIRIGYMPQDISLHGELSIVETLAYFGTLSGNDLTNKASLLAQISFLGKLLALPHLDRIICTLSGGQQRRVSLAVALINEPELLLLDEPTVGIDPLVRECIWNYLKYLVGEKKTTIIITTHYVEEAKGATKIGVMRDGRMIAENSPICLLNKFGVNSLETVFLELCKAQGSGYSNQSEQRDPNNDTALNSAITNGSLPKTRRFAHDSMRRMKALLIKNFKTLFRNIWMLIFVTLVPAMCTTVTCISFHHEPQGISLGVVNHELPNSQIICFENYFPVNESCEVDQLSCNFLRTIPSHIIYLKYFSNRQDAKIAVENGQTWGYILFPENYSSSVMERAYIADFEDDDVDGQIAWNSTKITVNLDQTNTMIYGTILEVLYETFESASLKTLTECGLDYRQGQYPLQYRDPVIGSKTVTNMNHIAPGIAVAILFFFPFTVSIRYIKEKRLGTMERCIVGGCKLWEILVAYAIPEACVLIMQSILVYSILHFGFSMGVSLSENPSNFVLILMLSIMQGLSGLACGFLLGILCNEETQAAIIIIATIFPSGFVSGLLWPKEGMPQIMQWMSPLFPMTLPGEALRSLINWERPFFHLSVWPGFVVASIYIFGCSLVTIYSVRSYRNK